MRVKHQTEKCLASLLGLDLPYPLLQTLATSLDAQRAPRLWLSANIVLLRTKVLHHSPLDDATEQQLLHLHAAIEHTHARDDPRRGTQLLQIYALQMHLYTRQKNLPRLRAVYNQALRAKPVVPHPRTSAQIHELGGRMLLQERNWGGALQEFFEAFKAYDEVACDQRIICLKWLVLASLLRQAREPNAVGRIDPMAAPETSAFRDEPAVALFTQLIHAYLGNNLEAFDTILRTMHEDDAVMAEHLCELQRELRLQALERHLTDTPITVFALEHVAATIRCATDAEMLQLLSQLHLERRIGGTIDATNMTFAKTDPSHESRRRCLLACARCATLCRTHLVNKQLH